MPAESVTTANSIVDRNAMSSEEFADAMIKGVTDAPAQLTCERMDQIEARWRDDTHERRCALVMLTKPGSDYLKMVESDPAFAKAVAAVMQHLPELIEFHECMVKLLQTVNTWSMVALAGREDMQSLLDAAKAEFAAPEVTHHANRYCDYS